MITEAFLRQHDRWIKPLTGLTVAQFWALFADIEASFEAYERQRHERPDRQREVGGGPPYAVPLLLRVVALITYLRLHLSQELIGLWFGMDQSQISRDLRRLLPLVAQHVPSPVVLTPVPEGEGPQEPLAVLEAAFGETGRALLDTTEQRIERPGDATKQREYYSGKKKQHTVKVQVITTAEGELVAITAPEPGKMADLKLAEQTRVVERLPEGTEVEADKAYQGLDQTVPEAGPPPDAEPPEPGGAGSGAEAGAAPPNPGAAAEEASARRPRVRVRTPFKKPRGGALTEAQKDYNRVLGRQRVPVEHTIGRLKNWRILGERFRCHGTIHGEVWRTIGGLVNLQFQDRRCRLAAA